jgi:site-specific recombinase XerC
MAPFCRVSGVGQSVEEGAQGEGLLLGETRHTFASHLVMRGANLRSVQELLGHKTGKKTVRYTHRSTPHLQETVNLSHRLFVPAPCGVEQGR